MLVDNHLNTDNESDNKTEGSKSTFRKRVRHRTYTYGIQQNFLVRDIILCHWSTLGLKIRGGKPNRAGRLCAYVTRVKPGSPADVVGQLRAGDEVLEWSGQSLRDCTADEVSRIVHQSKADAQVELIVQRFNFVNTDHSINYPVSS
ncbi:unnamed protein product [Echinostoma caproni]|uniref:PDZ domain-containing protein n=1 Tax=Echinostoma caproni TaxID=27848 RepID=A0A183BFX7_9TREM|nr:unnamed protein product [Echinostoma caproni]